MTTASELGTPTINMTPKKLKNPYFYEFINFIVDPYWEQIFENCSHGKFPKNSGFANTTNSVWCKDSKQKETFWYKLIGDPQTDFLNLKNFFKTNLNLKSKLDKIHNRDQFNLLKEELEKSYKLSWKEIKKKSIKDALIRNYILSLKENYNLDFDKTIILSRVIRLGLLFNWISSDHIDYKDKKIIDIKNLEYDEEKKEFRLQCPKKLAKRELKNQKSKLKDLWIGK